MHRNIVILEEKNLEQTDRINQLENDCEDHRRRNETLSESHKDLQMRISVLRESYDRMSETRLAPVERLVSKIHALKEDLNATHGKLENLRAAWDKREEEGDPETISRQGNQSGDCLRTETYIEHRIHHAGHGLPRT